MSNTLKLVRKITTWEAHATQESGPVIIGHVIEWLEEETGPKVTITTEGLEDPAITDFFIVHGQLSRKNDGQIPGLECAAGKWVVECRGQLWFADWLTKGTGYKGVSFLDAGYFYAPYLNQVR